MSQMGAGGRVWVITGASSGIGRRTAVDVARRGATVCAVARREDRLAGLVADLGGEDAGHSYRVTDVSDRDQVAALARHVAERHERCDVLVNNAGVSGPMGFRGPDDIDGVERVMGINFFGAVYCTGELLPLLRESAPSSIINVTSVAGRIAAPGIAAYCASKYALVGWSEALQPVLARKGIHVASVEPGFIPTEGFPQEDLKRDRLWKHLLASDEDVSAAIQDAVAGRKVQRTVPRYYYLAQVPKVLAPALFRFGIRKAMGGR